MVMSSATSRMPLAMRAAARVDFPVHEGPTSMAPPRSSPTVVAWTAAERPSSAEGLTEA